MQTTKPTAKKHKGLKILLICIAMIIVLAAALLLAVMIKPQIATSLLQKMQFSADNPANTWEPRMEPGEHLKENGILYLNDLKYGDTYPNSYLDISYPDQTPQKERPTLVYFHGGGFFGGDKCMGDPLAENSDSNALFDALTLEGFQFVNVNYCLLPVAHFPAPIIQANEAFNYLVENQEELHLNMHDVIIFGQSAGAGITAQYSALLSNPEYKSLFQLTEEPKLTLEDIRCIVVDDVPMDIEELEGLSIKILTGAYLNSTVFFENKELNDQYSALRYVTAAYPRTFLTAGTDDGFPKSMQALSERLTQLGVENEYFYTPEEKYGKTKHGYLSNIAADQSGAARDCFDAMLAFLRED